MKVPVGVSGSDIGGVVVMHGSDSSRLIEIELNYSHCVSDRE